MTDYTRCPGDGCELTEYRSGKMPMGFRYGCLGAKATQGEDTSRFVREWGAWVCEKSWRAYQALKRDGKLPPIDPVTIEHTRAFRARSRPVWLDHPKMRGEQS
jgi:hypothetical protein